MHGNLVLGGPVWAIATTFILFTIALAFYVLVDSLRPVRRTQAAERSRETGRAPWLFWVYAAVQVIFLGSLLLAQLLVGITLISALPVAVAPLAFGFGIAYLLRVVFPKAPRSSEGTADPDAPRSGSTDVG